MKILSVYDNDWISRASNQAPVDSWAYDVLKDLQGNGAIYLNNLRTWYGRFPKATIEIKNQLESFANEDHLGAVNEMFWWEWMSLFNWSAQPVLSKKYKRPDFHVQTPADFFCEVTTQNVSAPVSKAIESGLGVVDLLNERTGTKGRMFLKINKEKLDQIKYGASQKRPSVLILFDYTFWSGLGTQFHRYLADYLLGKQMGFSQLPAELSAIVYVERQVHDGQLKMSVQRSAVYHNPCASFRLPKNIFQMIRQYELELVEVPPVPSPVALDGWIQV